MKGKNVYTGVVISDIHIGAFSCEKLYEEFKEYFIGYINTLKKLDYIIICGDYFDHKLYLSDVASKYAHLMLQDMIGCFPDKKDVKIRFVYGTESHENNQYDALLAECKDLDIKVIKYVAEEELFPEMLVLYVPEEHIVSKEEYYKDYFQKLDYYTYVFGHGVIRETMRMAATQLETKASKRKTVPVFSSAELANICHGEVFFGHYHSHTDMDNVHYVGSFSRWIFGEEDEKGFYQLSYNPEKEKTETIFIPNSGAETYTTISFGYSNEVFQDESKLEEALNHVDELLATDAMDHVRFDFNVPKDINNPEYFINYVKERYKFNKAIKIEITNGYIKSKREQQQKEIQEENERYDFIFDKSLPIEEIVSRFISIEYNKEIPVDTIKHYLYEPLQDILLNMNGKD